MGDETTERSAHHESKESTKKSLFKNWPFMSSVITYCVFSLQDTAYDICSGGLSFSTKDVGQVLAVAGASLLLYQLFIYRWVHKVLGPISLTRTAAVLSIPIIAAYPFMTHLSGLKLGVALYSAVVVRGILAMTPQGQRGAANGISITTMSLFKVVAPAGAGVLILMGTKAPTGSILSRRSDGVSPTEFGRGDWAYDDLEAFPGSSSTTQSRHLGAAMSMFGTGLVYM
ncbi:hypothetical protein ACP70R_007442 [Stipagrostis hirtigluma subsp. patula]